MDTQHFIIIGNGPAGNQAALTLRNKAPEARITLISRHPGGCYRPHLLPHFISGKIEAEELYVFSPSSYKDKNIKLRSGQEVVAINLEKREIALEHKEVLPFDGLIIATGGNPRIPEHLTGFRDLMLTLKTLEDAKVWIKELSQTGSVLIIGGDLTSFAFTKTLISMGKKVYFALNEDAFWPLKFDNTLSEEAAYKLTQKGVQVLKHTQFDNMTGMSGGPVEVDTGKEKIRVGLIGAFFGLIPDIRFASKSGFKIDRGILVDEYLNTGFEGVYATGDCAQVYHPELQDYWVSIGHDNGVKLGRIAALNLAGEKIQADIAKESIFEVQGAKVNTSWWTEF
jgi:NAD(P)H-nitrite reductase large subunit